MRFSKGNLSRKHRAMLALLFVVPLMLAAGKWSALPTSTFLTRFVSLADIPPEMHSRLQYILFVPLGAIVVVLCRLTLGIRILGPFRSILIAVAFQVTGILLGLAFLTIVIGVIVAIRPLLKAMRLPYFGRVSVILSAVSVMMIVTILLSSWVEADALRRSGYFPIVVLCLTGEGFARTLAKEGPRSAMWRGTMTALLAVLITMISTVEGLQQLLMHFPELLIVQIGCIVVISEYFDLRLLQWINPAPSSEASGWKSERKASTEAREASLSGG